jgi:hypothetical protein
LSATPETHSGHLKPVTNQRGRSAASILVWIGLAIAAAVGIWLLIDAWGEGLSSGRDFVQDYAAVVKIGQGRNPYEPYNDVTQELFGGPPHRGPLYSFHAPSSLPLVIWLLPLAKLWGYVGAFLAWGVVSLFALWSICWLTLRAIGVPRPAMAGLLAALALMILPAIRESFEEGQLNVVVAAGIVGCWAARRSGRSGLAGVLLGGAFALKPIPGLFFLYYAWRRDWRLLGAAVATVALLAVVGVVLSGLDGARLWATVNYPSHADVWPGYPDNASVRGFFTRIFGPSEWRPRPRFPLPYASMLLWAASGALLALAAIVAARAGTHRPPDAGPTSAFATSLSGLAMPPPMSRNDPCGDLEIAVLTILTLLVTPIVWPHYYVVLVMPIVVTATYLGRLVLAGSIRSGSQLVAHPSPDARLDASDSGATGPAPSLDRRQRVLQALALAAVIVSTAILAGAHYVEPFREVGGQQLLALLSLYAGSLVALACSAASHGRGASPVAIRYSAI